MASRRCLIVVSGFFTYFLRNGEVIPYYVYAASGSPIGLGGVFNELEDGFLTCALIIVPANTFIKKIQNLNWGMPQVIDRSDYGKWLDPASAPKGLVHGLCRPDYPDLQAHPMSQDIYKQYLLHDTLPDPVSDAFPR